MKHKKLSFKTRPMNVRGCVVFIILACMAVLSINCKSPKTEYWMTYRHDNARSGVTFSSLDTPLSLHWTFKPTHPPKPAWPKPGEEMERMHFDNAFHVTAAKGMVYFGSSVDNKIYALNAKTGKIQWTFFTEGPVRFAPTLWKNRVYFGSDDGHIYCLRAGNGKLIWKYRAGPSDEKLLGSGRMISMWPVRTSVIVDDGIAYFGAGVFPYEGIYICALNARDGSVIWKNDTIGDRAHELAYGGISPQSYLIASENILYVPSGRAMPAAFGRKSGEFLYYLLPGAKVGGTWALLDKDNLIAGVDLSGMPAKIAYDEQTGMKKNVMDDMHAWFPGIDLIVTPDVSYTLTENGIYALDREKYLIIRGSKLNVLAKERQKLRDKRSVILKKIRETGLETGRRIYNPLIEEIEKKLVNLAEEEKNLKTSMFRWEYLNEKLCSLILAGNKLFAGGEGIVIAVDTQSGKELWKSEIQGKAQGLAVTDGNLFVSTDNGNIYCFAEGKTSIAKEIIPAINLSPYRRDRLTKIYESAAEKILKETGINKGYCLVLGCGTGRLAFELAKQSKMKIIGIEEDTKKINTAKNRLDSAGLYGSRVVVEQWDLSMLPDYFANLIVSDEMMISGEIKSSSEEMFRVLKPYRGVAYFGQSAEASKRAKSLELQNLLGWLRNSGAPEPEVDEENGIWVKTTRGKLEGAGSWTEQYGSPQNTASSGDQLVKGPLGVLWYGEPGSERMVERHAKAASPVSIDGRIFIQGEEVIMAYDAFNGTFLWERKIPGAVRARADMDGGNLAATEHALFVAAHEKCYCLDPETGETIRIFEIPESPDGSPHRWGYVSCTDNILYGSSATPLIRDYFTLREILIENGKWRETNEIPPQYRDEYENLTSNYPVPDDKLWTYFKRSGVLWRLMADFPDWEIYKSSKGALSENMMVSDMIFAIDSETGELLWKHHGKRIAHITITSGDGTIFFAESAVSKEQKKRAFQTRQELIRKGIYEKSEEGVAAFNDADVRFVVALDSKSGKKLWERLLDLTGSGGDGMGTAYQDGVLLIFQNVGTHDAWRFQEGSLRWRRLTALSAKNGNVLWSRPLNYNVRPVIVGNQIFIEPRACDLHTGKIEMRSHPITGKQVPWEYLRPGHTCAISSASANMLFYRSFSTAIYDFAEDRGLVLFGGIRPGCWINMIAANGVLLFPEASSGCTCSFPLRCSLVLKHKPKRSQPWTVFIAHGAMSPVKHFAINLGAPADMKDDKEQVWFAYPNPKTEYLSNHYPNYGVKFDLNDEILLGMGYFCSDFKSTTIEGSEKPWLFTSGCIGLSRLEIPLIDDAWGEEPGVYTLRLGFNAPLGDRTEQRVFSVKLQGKIVLNNFDIIREAGETNRALIKEFNGINVENILSVELIPKDSNPTMSQAPIINFIEVLREDVAKISEISEPLLSITRNYAEALLKEARAEFVKKNYANSLDKYHIVLDAAPSVNLKQKALEGMASIGSPDSLSRIAAYCRDTAPILWNYKEPKQELNNKAAEVLIAIAANTAKKDKQKAIKMFKNALVNASDDTYKKVIETLKKLGVKLDDASDK